MTKVFHVWVYGRFIEIQSNLRRKKLHKINQSSNFHGGSFSNRDNVTTLIQLEEKVNPSILNDDFSSKTDPSVFTSLSLVIRLVKQNQLSFPALKSINHFLPQSTVSCRSDSSSEVNSSC